MMKHIFVVAALLAGSVALAQQKKEKEPPPPPPPPIITNVKEVHPPPPPPAPPKPPVKKVKPPADYEAFLKRNPTVQGIDWLENKIQIRLKSGEKEEYDLDKKEDMQRVEEKYGKLPIAPPRIIKKTTS